MQVLETDAWSLLLPPEWWAEQEEEAVLIGDRDGVGCIEITTLHRERGAFEGDALRELAEEAGPDAVWRPAAVAGLEGLYSESSEEDSALREWCLGRGSVALYISYSCEADNRGLDDAAVDEILATLALDPDLS